MKRLLILLGTLLSLSLRSQLPHLKKNQYGAVQMVVKGKPFLMLAGELYNSSGSNMAHVDSILRKMKAASFNTAFVSLSWELIEPLENRFDLSSVDGLIGLARKLDMKLVFLWFGSWKNGISPYAPIWLMRDTEKYWRAKDSLGRNTQTLSAFCSATRQADKKAYQRTMEHIAKADATGNTVLAMQIENETGLFGQPRDLGQPANERFAEAVPSELMQYLTAHEANLEIEISNAWKQNGSRTKGTWTEVFGGSQLTDLLFMAWHYGRYANEISEAGKKIHPIPTYVNCWMPATPSPNPRPNHTKPGTFPSGGPVIMVADVWKAAAPSIDILAPDLYGKDFDLQASFFHRRDNPFFIPETVPIAGRACSAFANHDAICFSPFGIDNLTDSMKDEYALLEQLGPLILRMQGSGKLKAFYRNELDTLGGTLPLGKDAFVDLHLTRPYFNRSEPIGKDGKYPDTYGILINTDENECIVGGKNIYVSARSASPANDVWLRDVWEGVFVNGNWKPRTLMNGDEAGFLWNKKTPVYRVKSNPTIHPPLPTPPAIFKMKAMVYHL